MFKELLCDKGTTILSRDGKLKGTVMGTTFPCRLMGCNGIRITTKWPNGKITYPCSKGIIVRSGHWQIQ
jgi:hypothetical protein